MLNEIEVNKLIFRDDLYPRIEKSPQTVQKYAEDLNILPPIEINQHNEIIDGWHRWTAHKKEKSETIKVFVTDTKSDTHLLELAIERNASHGLQLSQEDKRNMARKIYHTTDERDREKKKKHLAKILSVSERTIREWLSRIDKDSKEARDKRIFELWMACYTQEEIAERERIDDRTVRDVLGEMAEVPKSLKPAADHLADFEPPIYNVWKQQEKTPGLNHPGNTEIRFVDNLLYLYTNPFDIVVDPFAGTGSTADICKKRFRRYWVSDRIIEPEFEGKIRKHDIISDGLPDLKGRWGDVSLVYLDPPYWKQAEGKYGGDETDFSNMSLPDFTKNLSRIILEFSKKIKSGFIALIIQPTQWNAPEKKFTDHITDILNKVKIPVEMRISVPYESQQCNAQMVEWAKENKKILVLTREIIVWSSK